MVTEEVTEEIRLHTEMQLAQALGWTNLFVAGGSLIGTPPDGAENSRGQAAVPRWTRDWNACGPLMTELEIEPTFCQEAAAAWADGNTDVTTLHCDHASKDLSIMFVIALAALGKLVCKVPA